jgi:ABC-2 type transport system permease protein
VRHLIRLVLTFLRLGALNELEYRANFFIQTFQAVLGMLVALGGLQIVFDHTEDLGGWQPAELLALVGVYQIVGGVINTVINPSMQRFMEDVRKGTLDFALTKPEDAQLMVSVREFRIWRFADIGLGLAVLLVALVQLGERVGGGQALLFGAALLCGSAIVYSFWLILATFSFWFVRVGEHPGYLPYDVPGGALAGGHLPAVVASDADLHRAGRVCRDGPGRGAGRAA